MSCMQITYIFIFLIVGTASSENVLVEVKKGDGIYSVLRRYDLHQNSCNLDSFLSLNHLGPTEFLVLGRKYKLPIAIYKFDGNTIRSTVGIDDFDKAVRIQKFNEVLVKEKIKGANYKDDKLLWVPYHELFCMGETNRIGSIEEGSTVSDYSPEEIDRNNSIQTSVMHGAWKNTKINIQLSKYSSHRSACLLAASMISWITLHKP